VYELFIKKLDNMKIEIEELFEAIKGFGTDDKPMTIGLFKMILTDLKERKERKLLKDRIFNK